MLRRGELVLLAVAVICLALATGGDSIRHALKLEFTTVLPHWRWLSGHFVHLGLMHCLMNVAALLLLTALFGRLYSAGEWLFVLTVSAISVSAGLVWWCDDIAWYVGLSGVLHGVFTAGLVRRLRRNDLEFWVLAIALLGKLGYELLIGPMPGSEAGAGGTVITESHAFGAVGGVLAGIVLLKVSLARERV